jgi:ribosomal protein L40E
MVCGFRNRETIKIAICFHCGALNPCPLLIRCRKNLKEFRLPFIWSK